MWSRWLTKTIDRELQVTTRDLDYFQFIFDCGATRSSAIHEYFNHGKSKQVTYRRLDEWSSRPYQFLYVPKQQRMREGANYKDLIRDITPHGMMLLIADGRIDERHMEWRKYIHRGSFWHGAMGAARLASIKLGLKRAGIPYVSKFEYFERMKIDPKANPLRVRIGEQDYIPDDLCGIGDSHVDTILFEDDMKTEPTERITSIGSDFISKAEKIEKHTEVIKKHFRVSRFKVLTTTTSEGHMLDMLKKVRRLPDSIRERLAFQCEPTFHPLTPTEYIPCPEHTENCKRCRGRNRIPVPFDDRCFQRAWLRSGFDPVTIGAESGCQVPTHT